jgi:hypothetical protein
MKSTRIFMFVLALVLNLWTIKANAVEHLCNRWNVLMNSGFELGPVYGEIWTEGYKLQGDTIINTMQYSRLLFADGHHKQQSESWEWVYSGALRETANAEIYFIPAGQNKEYLLFAFNAQVGDTMNNLYVMNNDYNAWAVVKDVSEKEIILDLYEQTDEGSDIFRHDYIWIKGIGAKRSMFQPLPNGGVAGCVVNFLLCAYNDETIIYTSESGEKYGCEYWSEHTAINHIEHEMPTSVKTFQNGQLLIRRGDKTYTATGQETK